MKTTLAITFALVSCFTQLSPASANDFDDIANGVIGLVNALSGTPPAPVIHYHGQPPTSQPVVTPWFPPNNVPVTGGPYLPGPVNTIPVNTVPPTNNPFQNSPGNPFGSQPTVNLSGVWNASGAGDVTIFQQGSDLTLSLGKSVYSGQINGNSVTVNATNGPMSGNLSFDQQTISFPSFTLTRPQSSSFSPPTGRTRQVWLTALKCVDLQNDRITDRNKTDAVTLEVYVDGQLVDNVKYQLTELDEGSTLTLNRSYNFRNTLQVKLLIGGNQVPGELTISASSMLANPTAVFEGGIHRQFDWTKYELQASVQ